MIGQQLSDDREGTSRVTMESRATILCIDDEEPGRILRKLLLERAGYRAVTAASGPEGLQIFRSQQVDAVIVDYWMAGMNGLAVARELKKISPEIRIIILSAFTPLLDEAIGLADVWIRKGEEDPEYLLGQVKMLLQNRASR